MSPPHKPPPPKGPPGSLQRRLLVGALALVTAALVVAGISIGFILHRFVRGQIDSRLDSQIVALVSDLDAEPGGGLRLRRNLDGPPFDRPKSGWAWQVRQGDRTLRSASLGGRDLALPEPMPEPGPHPDRPRPADGTGPHGEAAILRILALPERDITIVAAAPMSALYGPLREALGTLAISLAVLGIALVAGLLAQVRLGLRPLDRLRKDLADVRSGRRARVPEKQPAEIRPLVGEVNALLGQNEANLAHARTHVANLAHGLKTPLATLAIALSAPPLDPDGSLRRLVDGMDRRVRHHLRRARAAALGGPARASTPLRDRLLDLRTALERIHAEKAPSIAVEVADTLAVACDGEDVDEMLGNLVENACRWCRARVLVTAAASGSDILIAVEDDGPGLGPEATELALQRGRRLDESVPGDGFGLPITRELAELYGGSLTLSRSSLGGLRASLSLPAGLAAGG